MKSDFDSDTVLITLRVADGVIEEVKFKCMGCAVAIACSSMTTEMVLGKPVEEAYQITEQAVAEALGGIPEYKMRCSNLAPAAVRQAIDAWRAGVSTESSLDLMTGAAYRFSGSCVRLIGGTCLIRVLPGYSTMRMAAVVLVLCLCAIAAAQTPTGPTDRAHVRLTVVNSQGDPRLYSLEIFEDGTGSYTSSAAGETVSLSAGRQVRVHDPLLSRVFKTARAEHFFAMNCESPQHHVAFTGKKTLTYAGADGTGSCTFNYSGDRAVNETATMLMNVAYTLTVGARLKSEHLHDRLSLDAELEALQDEVAREHHTMELGNIAPELQSIADDDAVMERARKRATALLSEAGSAR